MPTSKSIRSPSQKYLLTITTQGAPTSGFSSNTVGVITKVEDGSLVAQIERNYPSFEHSFVSKKDQEYLITGRHYLGQTILNLNTGEEYNDPIYRSGAEYRGTEFIWIKCWLHPDGTTLIVNGCHWGGPSLYQFYDFSDPSHGWVQLEAPYLYEGDPDQNGPHFYEDGSFSLLTEDENEVPEKVVALKRDGNTIIKVP